MSKLTMKVEGLSELRAALGQFSEATSRNIQRRVLREVAKPIADTARQNAPVADGDLRDSIAVSTKLSPAQRKKHRRVHKDDVEVFVGAGPHPHAHLQEFGTSHHPAQPFMRPAWDSHKDKLVGEIARRLGTEIDKSAARAARKAARAAMTSKA